MVSATNGEFAMIVRALEGAKRLFSARGRAGTALAPGAAAADRVELEADGFLDAATRPLIGRRAASEVAPTPDWARDAITDARDWRAELSSFAALRPRLWAAGAALSAGLAAFGLIVAFDWTHAALSDDLRPAPIAAQVWAGLGGLLALSVYGIAAMGFAGDFKPGRRSRLWTSAVTDAAAIRGGVQAALDTTLRDRIEDLAAKAGGDPATNLLPWLNAWRTAERAHRGLAFRYDAFRAETADLLGERAAGAAFFDTALVAGAGGVVAAAIRRMQDGGAFRVLFDGDLAAGDEMTPALVASLAVAVAAGAIARLDFARRAAAYGRAYSAAFAAACLDRVPGRAGASVGSAESEAGVSPYALHQIARGLPEVDRVKRQAAADIASLPKKAAADIDSILERTRRRALAEFDRSELVRADLARSGVRTATSASPAAAGPEARTGAAGAAASPEPRWRVKPDGPAAVERRFEGAPRGFRFHDPAP